MHQQKFTTQTISDLIDSLSEGIMNDKFVNGPSRTMMQLNRFLEIIDAAKITLNGKRCIEVGCGPVKPFSIASLLYLMGADSILALDIQDIKNMNDVQLRTYALLIAVSTDLTPLTKINAPLKKLIYSRIADFNFEKIRSGNLFDGLPKNITHHAGNYLDLDMEQGQFDICLSFSVWEHIQNLPEMLLKMVKNILPGGFIFADIDYRDHRLYSEKKSPWEYIMDDQDHQPGYLNKLRHSSILRIIDEAGLRVIKITSVKADVPKKILENRHPSYLHLGIEDLQIQSDTLLLQKK